MAKPNSDKSSRAERRRGAREAAKAPQTSPQPPQRQAPPGLRVSTSDLLAKIGGLVVERDFLQQQVAQRDAAIEQLTATGVPEEGKTEGETAKTPPSEEEPDPALLKGAKD